LETSLQTAFSGFNTKHGELITIHLDNAGPATSCFVTLHYDSIVELRDSGAVLIE
jgi:hypothetical protein